MVVQLPQVNILAKLIEKVKIFRAFYEIFRKFFVIFRKIFENFRKDILAILRDICGEA